MTGSRYVIDRIADDIAVLEPLEGAPPGPLPLPAAWLPAGAREGDVLAVVVERASPASRVAFELDEAARRERESRIGRLRDSLPRGPAGDVDL
jgi:hypothetical protein